MCFKNASLVWSHYQTQHTFKYFMKWIWSFPVLIRSVAELAAYCSADISAIAPLCTWDHLKFFRSMESTAFPWAALLSGVSCSAGLAPAARHMERWPSTAAEPAQKWSLTNEITHQVQDYCQTSTSSYQRTVQKPHKTSPQEAILKNDETLRCEKWC